MDRTIDKETMVRVIDRLCKLADEKRKETDGYADMFEASEHGIRGLLSELNDKIMGLVLSACTVIEERTGNSVDNELFAFLRGISLYWGELEKEICDKEGLCCSVDKVRELAKEYALSRLRGGAGR